MCWQSNSTSHQIDCHQQCRLFNGVYINSEAIVTAGSFMFICITHAVFICPKQPATFTIFVFSILFNRDNTVWHSSTTKTTTDVNRELIAITVAKRLQFLAQLGFLLAGTKPLLWLCWFQTVLSSRVDSLLWRKLIFQNLDLQLDILQLPLIMLLVTLLLFCLYIYLERGSGTKCLIHLYN